MLKRSPTRIPAVLRFPRSLRWLSGIAILAVNSPLAQASVLSSVPDCNVTGGDWSCYLHGIFRFLLVIAIILGLVLAGVIFLAVKSYLKSKDEEKVGS